MEKALKRWSIWEHKTFYHCLLTTNSSITFSCLHCKFQAAFHSNKSNLKRSASPTDARDHLVRTKNMNRQRVIVPASVISIKDLSSKVKGIKLLIKKEQRSLATFKPGQWIDMMIPDITTVGGFSICNSPLNLLTEGWIELAVKYSDHPPAHWIHSECHVGSPVKVRVGGEFFYRDTDNKNVLLIAGGVGINPLLSILRHRRDLFLQNKAAENQHTSLLYSAKTMDQLIFKDEIVHICSENPVQYQFYITKDQSSGSNTTHVSYSKITQSDIESVVTKNMYKPSHTDCYICGPPIFINVIKQYLLNIGCLETNIYYEKWW